MKKYSLAIMIWIVFEAVAVSLWLTKHNLFYLFNFSYIGISLSFLFVSAPFLLKVGNLERIMFWTFLIGNLAYYLVGIALAFFSRIIGRSANISARLPYSLSQ